MVKKLTLIAALFLATQPALSQNALQLGSQTLNANMQYTLNYLNNSPMPDSVRAAAIQQVYATYGVSQQQINNLAGITPPPMPVIPTVVSTPMTMPQINVPVVNTIILPTDVTRVGF